MDRASIVRALRDTAQSASNAVAGNVSGPVDLIAAGLRGVGLPIPQNPVGGSQWMAERGLTREVPMGAPRIIGETLGMAGPALVANYAPQIASALNQGMANLATPRRLHPQTGAIVWHGSPHKFDEFDSSKIGTGEGAQRFGQGLYFAETPEVAREYLPTPRTLLNGQTLQTGFNQTGTTGNNFLDTYLLNSQGDAKKAASEILADAKAYPGSRRIYQQALADLRRIRGGLENDFGNLYKVDLPDEQIAKMLDWDKPLNQQPQGVQNFFTNYWRPPGDDTNLGDWLIPQISEGSMIEMDLARAGVPGIRYLDGVSRGTGAGTSNFVVFPGNEDMLRILERNGQPLGLLGVK